MIEISKNPKLVLIVSGVVLVVIFVLTASWAARPESIWVTPEYMLRHMSDTGSVYIRVNAAQVEKTVTDEILQSLETDKWGRISPRNNGERVIIYLGEEYELTAYPDANAVKLSYGYAPLNEKGYAYYEIPQEALNAIIGLGT